MSNARVRVQFAGFDSGRRYWTWECGGCQTDTRLPPFRTQKVAHAAATAHARSCPALSLARLREQITAAVVDIGRLRTIMRQRYGSTLTDVALTEATAIITEHTGITP